jgi:hypothetical protein
MTESVWSFDRRALYDGFRRIRELAADILADRWPPVPGERCFRCPVVDCEYHVGIPDASDLDLIEPGEEAGE